MAESWCRRTAAGWTIAVHVQPGAKRSEIVGLHGERLKIRVAAVAADGRANETLAAFVAERLRVPRSRVVIARGERSRDKVLALPADCDPTLLRVG